MCCLLKQFWCEEKCSRCSSKIVRYYTRLSLLNGTTTLFTLYHSFWSLLYIPNIIMTYMKLAKLQDTILLIMLLKIGFGFFLSASSYFSFLHYIQQIHRRSERVWLSSYTITICFVVCRNVEAHIPALLWILQWFSFSLHYI